jgi:hypothetical protein
VNQPNDIGKHGPFSQDSGKILPNTAAAKEALKVISAKSSTIDNKLFLYESPADGWIPSTIYKSDGLLKGLEVMNVKGVNGMYFYLGGESANEYKYGLVNVAAFLAQSMKETIKYDACDEVGLDCSHVFCYSYTVLLTSYVYRCIAELVGFGRWQVSIGTYLLALVTKCLLYSLIINFLLLYLFSRMLVVS